ncbi:protein of unknown function [Methylocaldum szegediense]|uniref:Transposase n=1 Tax=Methylocaldum szegediense TaxID=73780 RepID=A0ABM9HW59_9GAMM|nr:protein of unknown function [Methylocaldum szegediense]
MVCDTTLLDMKGAREDVTKLRPLVETCAIATFHATGHYSMSVNNDVQDCNLDFEWPGEGCR